jgi:hypothetical protein
MDPPKPEFPEISNKDRKPPVDLLVELLAWQEDRIDEQNILKLKGETTNPKIISGPGKRG